MRPYPFPRSSLVTTTDSTNRLLRWPTTLEILTWPSSLSVSLWPCRRTREMGNSGQDFCREWTRAPWLLCHSVLTRSAQGISRSGRRWMGTARIFSACSQSVCSFSFTSSSNVETFSTCCSWRSDVETGYRSTVNSSPDDGLEFASVIGSDLWWSGCS